MCGLPFSGKSVLARSLGQRLNLRVLSYDFEIYLPYQHLVPPGASLAAEYEFVQDIARGGIARILASGASLIYDDLLLDRDDRNELRAVSSATGARLVLVYLDTPLSVINQRRAENSRTHARTSIPDAKMALDASHLEPPGPDEHAIRVRPGDDPADVLTRIRAAIRACGNGC